MQIGISSIISDGFGTGSFVFGDIMVEQGNPSYGTIIGTGTTDHHLNWIYSDELGGSGVFAYGYMPYDIVADGNGGSFYVDGTFVETATIHQVIDDNEFHVSTRIIYQGSGGWSECLRPNLPTGIENSGTSYVDVYDNYGSVLGTYPTGTFSYVQRANGTCGTYDDYTYDYSSYPNGTYLTSWFDSAYGSTFEAYTDGAGGYYTIQI